jgi:hypothetical protein
LPSAAEVKRRAPAYWAAKYGSDSESTRTSSPVSGASMNLPSPMYRPTWCTYPFGSSKNTASPGSRSLRETGTPTSNCSAATRGNWIPSCAYEYCTSPEQSKPVAGLDPPHWYGVPM